MKTIDDYKEEIREKYKNERGGELIHYLNKPSPGRIKKACLWLFNYRQGNDDKAILKSFFEFDESHSNIGRFIKSFDREKLKPINNFLKGITTEMQSDIALELIALLIDFQPRPYAKYRLEENNSEFTEERVRTDILSNERPENTDAKESENLKGKDFDGRLKILLTIILTGLSILLTYNLFTGNSNECITWEKDHFEKVECKGGELEVAYNKDLLENFKKINVCDTTTFFKNGKPVVFYLKYKNKLEFFSWYGEHPVYKGKFLDPITAHIIETHVKPCDSIQ